MRELWDFPKTKHVEQVEQFAELLGTSVREALGKIEAVGGKGIVQQFKDRKGMRTPDLCFAMIAVTRPKIESILEIGIGMGEATNFLSRLFPEALIYTVDLAPDDLDYKRLSWGTNEIHIPQLEANLDRPNIRVFRSNSFFMPAFAMPEKFNLIFVDGCHEFPVVAWDIMYAYNHLAEDGFLIMHDYGRKEENHVKMTVDYIAARIPERVHYLPANLAETIKSKAP